LLTELLTKLLNFKLANTVTTIE